MKNKIYYRVFKVSISFLFFQHYGNSKVYKIKSRIDLILPVIKYSFITIFLGFGGRNFFKSAEALHINFTGGEDLTNLITESQYDDVTNAIWNNLSRGTASRIDRRIVSVMMDLQEKYLDDNGEAFSDSNLYHLSNELKRKGIRYVTKEDILDFFDSIKIVFRKK